VEHLQPLRNEQCMVQFMFRVGATNLAEETAEEAIYRVFHDFRA